MKFDLLSRNTMVLVDEILENQNLLKLVDSNKSNPIEQLDIKNKGSLMMNKIIPAPLTGQVPQDQQTNLRVFFPQGKLQNRAVLNSMIVFQVVTHKDLWMIRVGKDKDKKLRPYEIMSEIVNTFEGKTIKTLGVIHFKRFFFQHLDKDYGVYNLEAEMTTI